MTYFGVLIPFVIAPMLLLLFWSAQDVWQGLRRRNRGAVWQPYLVILMHVGLALFYTTPWDNYLVATGVWWYDPDLVIGIRLGWVPVEEYLFFIVQTMLTGFWALNLMRLKWLRAASPVRSNLPVRMKAFLLVGSAWLVSTAALLAGWKSGRYF
jgi:lycopene cyclase domain-containing protein